MALPNNLTTITVTGTYLDFYGNPLSGMVSFTPTSTELMDATAPAMLDAEPVVETLDVDGHFSVVLPCTDNADLAPAGWAYTVVEQIHGTRTYQITLPHTLGSSVDIATLAPVTGV